MKKIVVVLASLMVAACASSPKTNTSQAPQTTDQKASSVAGVTTAASSTAETELSKLTAAIEQLQKQRDYFDYKKYEIKPEYLGILQKEAEFIKAHKNDVVTIEGNADERGDEAYNLALGNKRSKAVLQHLQHLGVSAAQLKLVSYGKDKPRLTCHEEKCWKENRRVDFVHKLS